MPFATTSVMTRLRLRQPVVAPGMTSLMVILPGCVALSLRPPQDERSSPDAHEPGASALPLRICVMLRAGFAVAHAGVSERRPRRQSC
jgi:hypothetical protein